MSRNVRLSMIGFNGAGSGPDEKRANAMAMLKDAAFMHPDLACLPETLTGLGTDMEGWAASAETIPGPTTDAAAEIARQRSMHVICPVLERRDGRLHNSAAVIDRRGDIAGVYCKIHPTVSELERGVVPGDETPVFETDFGRIGVAICFDLNYREVAEGLAKNGAEIVFFPSMYCGGLQLQIWAHDFSVFVASAHSGGRSAVVDPLGRVLKWGSIYEPILTKEINLDGVVCHIDENERRWEAMRRKYGASLEIDVATDEGKFRLVSHHPRISAEEMIREFNLERLKPYFQRSESVRELALK